ncbi:hypothetical protein O3P69_016478 [Scylla paramamosain]|uniref:LAS1-like protein n=1 Tax=Scylla paramamosain TaxID=85552 RepID=A0AAW0TDE9_SCYPA
MGKAASTSADNIREEWLETYRATFSSDVGRWKDAKDTMLVWQARVEKLPAGVDVTLPLLQAKIVDVDPTVESSVKSIFLASALQRFVTSIVKLPQTNYYRAQSMHNLALEIGLPMHLVDLRNEIVHGHGGWAGGETVHRALDTAYKWIKGYYWDAEFEKSQMKQCDVSGISKERWQGFLSLLRKYTKLTISFARKKVPIYIKVKNALIRNLESLYLLDPEECTKAIVSHVLLPETRSDLARHHEGVDVCECGCCIDDRVLERVEPLLAFFCSIEEGIELLLSCLVKRGQEHSKLASEWVCIIAGALLELPCFSSQVSHCSGHLVVLEKPPGGVEWKRVVVDLLAAHSDWSTHTAFRIIESPETRITESQLESIKDLVYVFNGGSQARNGKESKASTHTGEDLYTIDSILATAKHLSLGDRRKLERLRIAVTGIASESTSSDVPLGVLAHQRNNSLFYKELILHYPDSDSAPLPSKRPKLQNSLG